MDDYEMDETENSGLSGLSFEEEGEETANITDASARGALMFGGSDVQARYGEAVKKYESSTQEVLNQIAAARDRLLKQPTEQSRSDQLRGLAMALAAPRERDDPRFYERQNLYTFLRDIGEYGAAQKKAEKEAKLKQESDIAKLDELRAKYEQQSALGLMEKLGPAYRESIKPAAAVRLPTSEFERMISDLPPEEQARLRRQRAEVMASRAQRAEKPEIDPNKPSTTVINRVSSVVNRDLKPISNRLGALNETRAAIADARSNPAQAPQVDRFFARLTGDSQLSQLEVNAVANAGSFPSRISNQLSKFFTGTPTDLSLDDKAQVLDELEKVLAPSFNAKRNQILSQFSVASDISPEAVERIVGPRYLSAEERRKLREQTLVTPPAEAIEFLKKNPNLASEFDKKYGAGASKKYLGE